MPKMIVELAADRTDRAVAYHGERRLDVHARHEAGIGIARFVDALVDHAQANHALVFDQRLRKQACPARSARCPSP